MVELPPPDPHSQILAELAEIKKLAESIRRSQHRATIAAVVKVLLYVALIGGALITLQPLLTKGLSALTGSSYQQMLEDTNPDAGTPPRLNELLQELRNAQATETRP